MLSLEEMQFVDRRFSEVDITTWLHLENLIIWFVIKPSPTNSRSFS